MEIEVLPNTITEPPSLETTHVDVLQRRDNADACRHLTFIITNPDPNNPTGSGFPASCNSFFNGVRPGSGLFTVDIEIPVSETSVMATFTILDSHNYGVLGPLPSLFSEFVHRLGVGITFLNTEGITSPQTVPSGNHPTQTSPSSLHIVSGLTPPAHPEGQSTTTIPDTNTTPQSPAIGSPTPSTGIAVTGSIDSKSSLASFPNSSGQSLTYTSLVPSIITTQRVSSESGQLVTESATLTVSVPTTVTAGSLTSGTEVSLVKPKHVNAGAVAGAVIGSVLLLFIIIVVLFYHIRRRNRGSPSTKFAMYASKTEGFTGSDTSYSSDDSSGIKVTYSEFVFDDPLLEKVRETRRAYNDLRSNY